MIHIDSHIHTNFSSDCRTPMESMVEKAVALGLSDICFTDHMDYDFPEHYELPFVFDPEPYVEKIKVLKKSHEANLNIRTGVELGLRVQVEPKIKVLLSQHDFDFVIGSIHLANNMDPYHTEYWEFFENEEKGILAFFENTLNCVKELEDFDSLGHLDYIIRYIPSGNHMLSYPKYSDIIDEILRQCIQKGKALEVNTSGYYKISKQPHPKKAILNRYLELSGELITIGSDAHATQHLAAFFEPCSMLLKEIGFRAYTVYQERKPVFYDL